jgi:hypothetical protein
LCFPSRVLTPKTLISGEDENEAAAEEKKDSKESADQADDQNVESNGNKQVYLFIYYCWNNIYLFIISKSIFSMHFILSLRSIGITPKKC